MATAANTGSTKKRSTANGRDDSHPISDKAQSALHSGVDALAEKTAVAEEKVRQAASSSADAIAEKQEQIQSAWRQSEVRKFAKRNPLATAGIAFAAGALLTSFLTRNK